MTGHEVYSRKADTDVEDWMEEYGVPPPGPGYVVDVTETHYVEEHYDIEGWSKPELEEIGRPDTTSWTAKDIFELTEELSKYRWSTGDDEYLSSELERHPESISGKAHYVEREAEIKRADGEMLTPNEIESIYEGVGVDLPQRASYKEGKMSTAKEDDGVWDLPPGWTEQSAKDYWKGMGGSVTKCIEGLEDKEEIKDAGAFCSTLEDRVRSGGSDWRHEPRKSSTEELLDFLYSTGRLLTAEDLEDEDYVVFANSICIAMEELEVRREAEFGEQALEEARFFDQEG